MGFFKKIPPFKVSEIAKQTVRASSSFGILHKKAAILRKYIFPKMTAFKFCFDLFTPF